MLENKIIIVTGGDGLLGRQMVSDINEKGGVGICADINVETNLAKGTLFCDITNLEGIKLAIENVVNHFGRIDGLVNNAYPRTKDWGVDFEQLTEESLNKNVNWQLNSYILFCQQVIKQMKKGKGGAIVNIASIYGVVGNDFTIYEGTNLNPPAPYSAIKGGIINFTRFIASKYGEANIRANVVSPGGIFDHQPEKFVKAYEQRVPMRRMGNPDDIAPAISFLLSNQSKYITGQNIIVDGGWTAI
ncbi:oxidoreductase [uncultured Roseivirga sp.]|uniref:oxidoreductase n=1 Tax=uncultured Roseivirga sp. TaxID=543088 RepID=UPI0030DCABA9